MFGDEKLKGQVDQVKPLSKEQADKIKKEKAADMRKKYEISEKISDEDILASEGKIIEGLTQNIEATEQELSTVEGNVAEKLVKAAESDNDHDITAALGTAQVYHSKSNSYAKHTLKKKKKKLITNIFKNYA